MTGKSAMTPGAEAQRPGRAAGDVPSGGWTARAMRAALIVSAATSLVALALLAALLVPGIRSAFAAETADGVRAFGIADRASILGPGASAMETPGAAAVVVPEAGWSVRPAPDGRGLVARSPDGVLEVRLRPADSADADELLAARAGGELVLRETLSSGLEIRHVTAGERLIGAIDTGGQAILVDAGTADASTVDASRGVENAGGHDLARYRGALGGLLEGVTAVD